MADVFTVLSQDHQEVKRMLAELENGPTRATGASEDQLALRKKMTEQLIIEESKHEALEEMYFWPVVRDHLRDGDTLADQEQEAKEVLAKLDKLDAGDAEFDKLLGTFTEAAREHIQFEEIAVWLGLRTALNTERAAELGTQIRRGQKDRAHPPASAHTALARRAQGGRAGRDRSGPAPGDARRGGEHHPGPAGRRVRQFQGSSFPGRRGQDLGPARPSGAAGRRGFRTAVV